MYTLQLFIDYCNWCPPATTHIKKYKYFQHARMQEVCQEVTNWILQEPRIRKHYYITDPREVTKDNWYGVLTCIKIATFSKPAPAGTVTPTLSCVYQPFSPSASRLGRGILLVRGAWGAKNTFIAFGNVHLESPVGGVTPLHRKQQLEISANILRKVSPSE